MKNITITLSLLISTGVFANELAWVDEQVEAIKPSRIGLQNSDLLRIKSPFIFLEKNMSDEKKAKIEEAKKARLEATPANLTSVVSNSTNSTTTAVKRTSQSFTLHAILNNSVLINDKWYRLGESVGRYKIQKISQASVLLTKGKKKLLLTTKTKNKKIKFQNKQD